MDKRLQYRWPRAPRPRLPMRVIARVEHSEKLDDHERRVFFGAVDAQLLDQIDAMWTRGQYCGPDWLNPSSKPHDPLVLSTSTRALAPAGANGRLVYSYGKGNVWKHPRKAAFAAHEAGGWPSHPNGKHATVRRTALRKNGGFGHVPLAPGKLSTAICCRESIPPGRKRCDLCPASHQF